MIKLTIGLLAATLLCSACATSGVDEMDTLAAPSAAAVTSEASVGNPDEMICQEEDVTGSRFGKKTCMTRRERERRAAAAEQDTRGGVQRGLQNGNPSGN